MKKLIQCLSLASWLVASATFAQTAATTPVGFISETVAGGTLASPKLTLLSPTLTQPIAFQGTITSITGTTITVTGANWTSGQFNGANGEYYVEVFSATKPGALSDITATGVSSVTTMDNLTAFAGTGDSIAIRKHVTISDLLGATNSFGLLASDDPTTADEVLLYDGANGVSYFYYTGSPGFPAGWWDSGFTAQAGGVAIPPHDGVVIRRRGTGNVAIVSVGTVKTGNTLFPVYSGLNVLGTISAMGLTLDSSGLYQSNGSGITASDDPTTGDEVILYGANGPTNYFYYTGSPGFPAGWWDSGFTARAGGAAIAPGTAFVLRHKVGGPFNWAVPSPVTF